MLVLVLLQSLGLDRPISFAPKPRPQHKRRLEKDLAVGPRRVSSRVKGDGSASLDDGLQDSDDDGLEDGPKRQRTFFYSDGRDYGQDRSEKTWNMARVFDRHGPSLYP